MHWTSPHRNSIRSRCLFGVYNLCAVHGCKWCWCLCCCCCRRRCRRRHRFKFIDEMRSVTHSHTRYRRRSVLPLYRTVSSYCWYSVGYECTIRALWLCVSGNLELNMAASQGAGVTVSPMTFNCTTRSRNTIHPHANRSWSERQPERVSKRCDICLRSIFGITLSQCHILMQWRRNVLISTGNGSRYFIVNDQFMAHALCGWTFCWGNCIDLFFEFGES